MSKSNQSNMHALECLRLEADCRELAKNVRSSDLQSHYLKMAGGWLALAESGPMSRAAEAAFEAGAWVN